MASTAILAIRIISDATKAAKGFQQTETGLAKVERRMGTASKVATGIVAGLGAVGKAAFDQASRLQQAQGAVESVFGKQAQAVDGLAKKAATSVGLARSQYSELASVIGAQLGNMGVAQGKLVGTTDALIKQGADMAATFGGSTSEAVEALSSALRGETDPIERYGVSIKQATIAAELHKRGQDKLTGAALKQAQTQVLLDLITKQTAKSQGQFARESDSAAGAQQIAMAKITNAGATLGTVLLPIVAAIAGGMAKAAGAVEKHQGAVTRLVVVVGGLAVAVITANAAIKAYKTIQTVVTAATKGWAIAQKVLNVALKANPIGLVITAITIVVGLLILAYKKSSTFRAIVQAVGRAGAAAFQAMARVFATVVAALVRGWDRVKAAGASLASWVREKVPAAFRTAQQIAAKAFYALTLPIRTIINLVADLINKIRSIRFPSPPAWLGKIGSGISGAFGFASMTSSPTLTSGTGLMAAPSLMGAKTLTGSSSGTSGGRTRSGQPVQIIIQGAIDPVSTARQINEILGRQARRFGIA